ELASFENFNATHQAFLDQLTESIGIVLNTLEANLRTEDLLKQSQSLARELQSQQEELQQTNQELAEKAQLLAEQNVEVERKNREVEQARQALEEKAKQLALTSKYKSDYVDRTFRHVAENKRLDFDISMAPALPRIIHTDAKRLQQIIKNLLSNAFKFTEAGKVSLRFDHADHGWNTETTTLNRAKTVIA